MVPTDRTGWLVVLAAGGNLLAHGTLLALIAVNKPGVLSRMWQDVLVWNLPALLIVAAAGLGYRLRSPVRLAVVFAAMLALAGQLGALDPWFGRPLASLVGPEKLRSAHNTLGVTPWSYLIAAVAIVSAVVALWRQDRLAGDGSDA